MVDLRFSLQMQKSVAQSVLINPRPWRDAAASRDGWSATLLSTANVLRAPASWRLSPARQSSAPCDVPANRHHAAAAPLEWHAILLRSKGSQPHRPSRTRL